MTVCLDECKVPILGMRWPVSLYCGASRRRERLDKRGFSMTGFHMPWILGLAVAMLTTACGASGNAATSNSSTPYASATASSIPKRLANVSFNLAWAPEGYQAPIAYGVTQGIYKKYGLNVHLVTGSGSQPSVEAIAKGDQMFGLSDGSTLATMVSQGVKAVAVMGYVQQSPIAIIVSAKSKITTPNQLAGKTLAVTPAGPTYELLPAFLKAVGLSPGSVHELSMSGPSRIPAIISGKAVGEPALGAIEDGPVLESKGVPVRYFPYSRYGVRIPETLDVITSPQVLAKDSGTVQKFVSATLVAISEAEKNPRAAAQAQASLFPAAAPPVNVMTAQLKGTFPLLRTSADVGKPLGWMAGSDWQAALHLAQQYTKASPSLSIKMLYTNQFVDAATRTRG